MPWGTYAYVWGMAGRPAGPGRAGWASRAGRARLGQAGQAGLGQPTGWARPASQPAALVWPSLAQLEPI